MTTWNPAGAGLWTREYDFRGNPINSLAIDLGDGNLAVLSPGIDVPEADFAELDKLGKTVALVSPGAFHNMGLPLWSERYPDAGLFGPQNAAAHIAKQHKALKPLADLEALAKLLPDDVTIAEMPGMKQPDVLAIIKRDDGVTWFTNEVVTNARALPGSPIFALAFKLTGSGPGLNINKLAMMLVGGKKPIVRDYLLERLNTDAPTRLIPCHGDVLEDPALADKLREMLNRRLG